MFHLLKMLAVPFAFVAAFILFGAPSAPATALLADSGAACAHENMCYGGYEPDGGGCYGFVPTKNNGCEPEYCAQARGDVAFLNMYTPMPSPAWA